MEDDENGVPGLKISSIVTMSGQNTVDNTDESSQPSEEGSNSKSNGGENNVSFLKRYLQDTRCFEKGES